MASVKQSKVIFEPRRCEKPPKGVPAGALAAIFLRGQMPVRGMEKEPSSRFGPILRSSGSSARSWLWRWTRSEDRREDEDGSEPAEAAVLTDHLFLSLSASSSLLNL